MLTSVAFQPGMTIVHTQIEACLVLEGNVVSFLHQFWTLTAENVVAIGLRRSLVCGESCNTLPNCSVDLTYLRISENVTLRSPMAHHQMYFSPYSVAWHMVPESFLRNVWLMHSFHYSACHGADFTSHITGYSLSCPLAWPKVTIQILSKGSTGICGAVISALYHCLL